MPIFMDLHIVPGVSAKDVAEAHRMDVYIEKDHHCTCLTYWVDEPRGHVFCLIDAPNKESVMELHNRSHGLTPHQIIEVNPGLVQSFLGRIKDPELTQLTESGLPIIDDGSFRILLTTLMEENYVSYEGMNSDQVREVRQKRYELLQKIIAAHLGSEAMLEGDYFIASFVNVGDALAAAKSIAEQLAGSTGLQHFTVSLHAGEPVEKADKLFGETIALSKALCALQMPEKIRLSAAIKAMLTEDQLLQLSKQACILPLQDEEMLDTLFETLELHYDNADFGIDQLTKEMAMSNSAIYRRCVAVTGYSPNDLLRDFRLAKATQLIRLQKDSLTAVAYKTGFASPSYFGKCFKKRFGLMPIRFAEWAKLSV
jgi:AraC-like DNA-binding protein